MKIVLHGLNYAPEELGIGKYSGEMITGLAESGHQCVVVTTPPYYPQWQVWDGYRGLCYRREREESEAGRYSGEPVRVIRCPIWVPRTVTGFKRILHLASFGISSFPVVLWTALRFRPDVIMTVQPTTCCLPGAWLASKLCGAKSWVHVQDFEVDAAFDLGMLKSRGLRRVVSASEKRLMRRFDRASSISPNMITKLKDKGVKSPRIRALPNWVDCGEMKPLVDDALGEGRLEETPDLAKKLRKRFGLPADRFIALYAGSIGEKQGLDTLVEAAEELNNSGSHIHFVVCGAGSARDALAQKARGIKNFQMLPVQPFESFNELLNCADVHLLPQKAGAADLVMPSKLTGMLATGKPVLACADKHTQIAEVVEGCGIVVEPERPSQIVDALWQLHASPALCAELGRNARRYAVEHLDRRVILGQLENDLLELVGRLPATTPERAACLEESAAPQPCVDAGVLKQAVGLHSIDGDVTS